MKLFKFSQNGRSWLLKKNIIIRSFSTPLLLIMSTLYFGKRGARGNVYVDLFNLLYDKRQGQYISEKKDNALADAVIDRLEGLIEVLFKKEKPFLAAQRAKEKRRRELLRMRKEKEIIRSHRIASRLSKLKERETLEKRRAVSNPKRLQSSKKETLIQKPPGKIKRLLGNIINMVSKKRKIQATEQPKTIEDNPDENYNLVELFNENNQLASAAADNQPPTSQAGVTYKDPFVNNSVDSGEANKDATQGPNIIAADNDYVFEQLLAPRNLFDDDYDTMSIQQDLEGLDVDNIDDVNQNDDQYNLDMYLNIFVDGDKQTLRQFLDLVKYNHISGNEISQHELDAMKANTFFSLVFKNELEVTIDSKVIVYTCLELLDCLIIEPDALNTFNFMKFSTSEFEVVKKLCAAELCILLLFRDSKFDTTALGEVLNKVILEYNNSNSSKQLQSAAFSVVLGKWLEHVHTPLMKSKNGLQYGPDNNSADLLKSLALSITGAVKQVELATFVKRWLETTTFFDPAHISTKKYFSVLIDDYERLKSSTFYKFMMADATDTGDKEFTLFEIEKWLSHCLYITYSTVRPRTQLIFRSGSTATYDSIVTYMLEAPIMDVFLTSQMNIVTNLTSEAMDELTNIKKQAFELYYSTVTNPFAMKTESCFIDTNVKDLYQAYDDEEDATLCRAPIFSFRKPMLEQAKKYLFTRFSIAEDQRAAIEHQLELYALRSMESSLLADEVDEFYTQARLFFVKGFVHVGLEHPRVWMRPILYILYKITLKTSIFWLTTNQQRLNEMFDFEKSVVLKQPTIDFKTFQNYTSLLT